MRFWDSSAIVPLLVLEKETEACVKALQSDQEIIVWTMSKIEVFSALCRRLREGSIKEHLFDSAKKRMNHFFDIAFEVISVPKVKDRALRLLQVHPLRAADAMQLAAVLVATQEDTSRVPIMSFDDRLIQAAKREGFAVNPD
ncbi:MAG: type II toxin-antitoxin system VapC family toxin [Deltaproteobacteria bacterium]|nr:type II toxin-antitoxin system VapC family toxin [Deltaproteobacteria bacterium]MBW2074931.1 type II toxin-antitoxin system VapC family toxin [Deltaproteobacteria bacterium]RLB80588.1 MAG: PIN domain-containing protein [Deltaproteobacteria bacterium]